MKVVRPINVDDTVLVSSSVTETDYPEWVAGTYAVGDRRIRSITHRIYERLVAGSSTIPPENDLNGTPVPNWKDVGPTNMMAMFDNEVSTSTVFGPSGSVVLHPDGFMNSVSLVNVYSGTIIISMVYGDEEVFHKRYDMDGTIITDLYSYLFEPYIFKDNLVVVDLPPYLSPTITITFSGLSVNSCGVCVIGRAREIGGLRRKSGFGITDFSTKDVDPTFGTTTFVRRGNSDVLNCLLTIDNNLIPAFRQTLKSLTATPCAWIGIDKMGREYMSAYGWYGDFVVVIEYDTFSTCNLTIKGLM